MQTPPISRVGLALALSFSFAACGGGMSRYEGMTPEALFTLANNELQSGEHDDAARTLDRLLVTHGDWERLPDARMLLGDVYFDREDFLTARSEYQRFLSRYPGHPRSAEAALGICKSLVGLAYTEEALADCSNVSVDFAGLPEAAEAAQLVADLRLKLAEKDYLNGDFYLRRELFDSALKYFEFVATLYPESEFAPMALLRMFEVNTLIGYDDLADRARERLLERYPDSDQAAEIRIRGSSG
jgi:outer membrane protein assembly factor BamD